VLSGGGPATSAERPSRPDGDPRHGHGAERFDLQAHCGGLGLTVENSLASFSRALDIGVTTLELDVQIIEDGHAVVTHDRDPSTRKCVDTTPPVTGDPEFPYVAGTRYIKDVTLAQVTLNVETKVEAGAPQQTAPREQLVQDVAHEVRAAGLLDQVTVQSFDWGALMRMREVAPELPIVALTNGQQFLQAGQPGASPWLGGIDIDIGVDGLITDYPDRLRALMADNGFKLPEAHPRRKDIP